MNTNWLYDTNSEVNAIKYSEVDHVVRHDIPTNKQKMSTNQVQIGKKMPRSTLVGHITIRLSQTEEHLWFDNHWIHMYPGFIKKS